MATPATESLIWKGTPSQITEFWFYTGCIISILVFAAGGIFLMPLLALLIALPVIAVLGKWLIVRSTCYEVTTERIKMSKGLFSKTMQELELYRVRDTTLVQPFLYRMFGRGNIVLNTNDASTPVVTLECIPLATETREKLRNAIELCRERKNVRFAELGGEAHEDPTAPGI